MKPQKIFGIGLNKTGTKTLARSLKLLGFVDHVSCRRDLLIKYRSGMIDALFDVAERNFYFEDWPWPLAYKEMFFRFGRSARFILTKRLSAETWLESLKKHALRNSPSDHCRLLAYGYNYPHGLERYHLDCYEKHNREVVKFFVDHNCSDILLEISFDRGDGWEVLCAFLGVAIPDVAFPHENKGNMKIDEQIVNENQLRINEQLKLLGQR